MASKNTNLCHRRRYTSVEGVGTLKSPLITYGMWAYWCSETKDGWTSTPCAHEPRTSNPKRPPVDMEAIRLLSPEERATLGRQRPARVVVVSLNGKLQSVVGPFHDDSATTQWIEEDKSSAFLRAGTTYEDVMLVAPAEGRPT